MRRPIQFGKYLLLDRISVGGMAEVFKAKSFGVQGFEKVIAIKRILPAMGQDEEFINMFIDEAKIAGQLAHANIGQIHELGRIEGSHFIAMEYIWGRDLLQFQNRYKKLRRRLSVTSACFIVMKICEGLHYAHKKRDVLGTAMQIVHRDCSPQNVVLSYEGEVKLIDFGIARAASRSARTNAGVLKGKFGYMSPEQVRGLPLDRRSDIFSLGTILFECLTGRRLFSGESDFSTLEKVRNAEVDTQLLDAAGVPEQVKTIVLKALKRTPDDRYQWCADMRDDIKGYLQTVEEVYTYRSLGEEMRKVFADELEREKQLMDVYSKIGKEGIPEELKAQVLVASDESSIEGYEEGAPELKESALARGSQPRRATTGMEDFEDNPTEIFGEFGIEDFVTESEGGTSEPQTPEIGEQKVLVHNVKGSGPKADPGPPTNTPPPSTPPPAVRPRGGTAEIPRSELDFGAGTTPVNITPLGRLTRPGAATLPPPGRRPPPLTTTHSNRRGRDIMIGVGVAVVTVLLFFGVKTMVLDKSSKVDSSEMATLVVLLSDKGPAEVLLGDKNVGKVPPGEALTIERLEPGDYPIRIVRGDEIACTANVKLDAERVKVFNCQVKDPRLAKLTLEDFHEGDQVVIDGKSMQLADMGTGFPLQAERRHSIAVTRDGTLIDEFDITLKENEVRRHKIVRNKVEQEAGSEGEDEGETLEMKPDLVESTETSDDKEPANEKDKTSIRDKSEGPKGAAKLLGLEADKEKRDTTGKPKPPNDDAEGTGLQPPAIETSSEPKAEFGYLTAWTRPWARIYVDGKDTGKVTPIAPGAKLKLKPGPHKVTFKVGSKSHVFNVTIKPGKLTKLQKVLQ